jgi:hypothetical protein
VMAKLIVYLNVDNFFSEYEVFKRFFQKKTNNLKGKSFLYNIDIRGVTRGAFYENLATNYHAATFDALVSRTLLAVPSKQKFLPLEVRFISFTLG